MSSNQSEKIEILLNRGVEAIYPSKENLKEKLESGEKLTIYQGFDPTGEFLHVGHAIGLKKLKHFQDLGHTIIMLIGDFTAQIGDPTDKSATRTQLTKEEVLKNCKNYQEQAAKILDFNGNNPAELKYNSEWLEKLSFADVIELAAHFTVQQMLERDMFDKRMKAGKPIGLHEFMYPLMQGYDSVALKIDGEVGGNDQMFNMMAGRTLERQILDKDKFVLTTKLLEDTTGKKMGKTEGNMITLIDSPQEMYGKVMSWTDGMIYRGFELCTDEPMDEIEKLCRDMNKNKINPRDLKMRLARDIVALYYDRDSANKAEEDFKQLFQKKERPDEIEEVEVTSRNIVDVLLETKLVSSKSEARRLINQNGVKINDIIVEDDTLEMLDSDEIILQKGKRHFRKLILK